MEHHSQLNIAEEHDRGKHHWFFFPKYRPGHPEYHIFSFSEKDLVPIKVVKKHFI